MSCIGCKCNSCAFNSNLGSQYFTPGEVDECCYNCDDCCAGNGKGRRKPECDHFRKPVKKVEMEARIARSKLRLMQGEKGKLPNE